MRNPLIALVLIVPPLLMMATPSAAQPRQRPSESCHSGPMLNKQLSDEEGLLVEVFFMHNGSEIVDTDLLIVAQGLAEQIEMTNASGISATGDPYCREFLPNGVLLPGQSLVKTLRFTRQSDDPPLSYTLLLLSGQGNP